MTLDKVIKEMSEFLGISEEKLNNMRLIDFIELYKDYQAAKLSSELEMVRPTSFSEDGPLDKIE